MRIRFHSVRAFVPAVCLLAATVAPSFSQTPAPPASAPAAPASTTPASTTPATTTPATTTPAAGAAAAKEPDYPDPRRLFIGFTALSPLQSQGPDIRGGVLAIQAGTYESIYGIGTTYRLALGGEAGVPLTRTGTIYADYEKYRGSGAQVLSRNTFINSFSYAKGDQISTVYRVLTGRVYLDDLLYPHKFPVSRFRLKSIWGVRYFNISEATVSATEDLTIGTPGGSEADNGYTIFFPEFGLAMEYAPTKHTLFRIDGEGFAFPHHSVLTEGAATLSFRAQNLEFLMGVKGMHFKSSPQNEEYVMGTFISPFVGLRWYF